MPTWNWRDEGFATEPRRETVTEKVRVFRVWGGRSSKMGSPHRLGVCFSAQKPISKKWAELLFSLWEWGNDCTWVTEFEVQPGTSLYIARVDIGSAAPDLEDRRGVQVFIENPVAGRVKEIATERLNHDLDAGWLFSGPPNTTAH